MSPTRLHRPAIGFVSHHGVLTRRECIQILPMDVGSVCLLHTAATVAFEWFNKDGALKVSHLFHDRLNASPLEGAEDLRQVMAEVHARMDEVTLLERAADAEGAWGVEYQLLSPVFLARVLPDAVHLAWAGDIYAVWLREGALLAQTSPHTMGNAYPQMVYEEAMARIIVNSLGQGAPPRIDTVSWAVEPGDRVLFCRGFASPDDAPELLAMMARPSRQEAALEVIDAVQREEPQTWKAVVIYDF